MTTTIKLVDAAKRATGCETDYQFMKRFSIKQGTMSGWRTGRRSLDDESCEFCGQTLCREQTDDLPANPSEELMRLRRRVLVLELVLRAQGASVARTRMESCRATDPA